MRFQIISSDTLSEYMKKQRTLLIDLRDPMDYQASHIPGAVWMDWEHAETDIHDLLEDFRRWNGFFPNWIILYCDYGNISLVTARDLARCGYPVMSLNGGYHRWTDDRKPVA